jgi:arylsulfatase
VDPRFGKVGRQVCKDTGPLTKKRMETIDDDVVAARHRLHPAPAQGREAVLHLDQHDAHAPSHAHQAGEPGAGGQGAELLSRRHGRPRQEPGTVLKALDDLGIANETFFMYSTDNGPHMNTWPDGGMTPFRNEKNSNWEGAYRVPAIVRWPGRIKPGQVSNEMVGHHDWLPTFCAIAGDTDVTQKLLKGYKVGDMTYKVHLDGYNLVPYLTGAEQESPRKMFLYVNDDQQVTGLRYENWKAVFMEQRMHGTLQVWAEPFVTLRMPKLFNLRTDPYERADITSNTYWDWVMDHPSCSCRRRTSWPVPGDVQGVSAAPEGRELQPGRRPGQDEGRGRKMSCKAKMAVGVACVALLGGCGSDPPRPTVSVSVGQQLIDLKKARDSGHSRSASTIRRRRSSFAASNRGHP